MLHKKFTQVIFCILTVFCSASSADTGSDLYWPVGDMKNKESIKYLNDHIEIKSQPGASVHAVCDGIVKSIFQHKNDTILAMESNCRNLGMVYAYYVNIAELLVSEGSLVNAGEVIGKIANDGNHVLEFSLSKSFNKEKIIADDYIDVSTFLFQQKSAAQIQPKSLWPTKPNLKAYSIYYPGSNLYQGQYTTTAEIEYGVENQDISRYFIIWVQLCNGSSWFSCSAPFDLGKTTVWSAKKGKYRTKVNVSLPTYFKTYNGKQTQLKLNAYLDKNNTLSESSESDNQKLSVGSVTVPAKY